MVGHWLMRMFEVGTRKAAIGTNLQQSKISIEIGLICKAALRIC
jgi:hypothetical protein